MKIKREIEFKLPDIKFEDEKQKEYFEDLLVDVVKKDGVVGLITALERKLQL